MYLGRMGQQYGTYPVYSIAIEEYERRRAEVEREALRLHMTPEEWLPLLPVPKMNYIHDPVTGKWYRAGDITQIAWEIMPPVVGQTPGTWVQGRVLTDAEAAAWIAKVEATRQPLYGSPLTIPTRMGWTEPLTDAEIAVWADSLGWQNEKVEQFFASFPSREAARAWLNEAQLHPEMWQQKSDELWGRPAPYVPPSAAPPPPPPAAPPPAYTPPPGYYPHQGTPELRAHGWPPDVIGFWLTQAFNGDLALTEAFLLSFPGREALDAWVQGKSPEEVWARARAALGARPPVTAPPPVTYPPGAEPPPGGAPSEGFGISLPLLALIGAGVYAFTRR